MKIFNLPIEVEFVDDIYVARCNLIQWAFASWETSDEALKELIDVIRMIREFKKDTTNLSDYRMSAKKIFTSLPIAI
jgi:hypothetical protein